MKKTVHPSFFIFFVCLLATPLLQAQGPDAFGYTWKDSNDPEGPVFEWIDISAVGTEVMGLGDDNSVAAMPMGMDFRFYWSDFNQIKIGSNGWLSFDNVSNIASCFPILPTVGGPNNLICPLMSDLNFDNNSPGKIYTYHDDTPGDEKYIISYENVTFWTQADPIFGSNTFQVILSNADSSITFQYGAMDVDFTYTCTGSGKVAVGIENLTGEIGLEVFSGVVPPSNYAVKFYYPEVITLSITDVAPISNQNDENEGIFLLPDEMVTFTSTIANTGNTDITTQIAVAATVQQLDGTNIYLDVQEAAPLAAGESAVVNFSPANIDWAPGPYFLDVLTALTSDVNPNNDNNITELNVVDLSAETLTLGYVLGVNGAGLIQWSGGGDGSGGAGIEIEPPFYPTVVTGAEVGIAGGSTDGFTIRLFDDDGPNGAPGTELASVTIPGGGYLAGAFNAIDFDSPVTITDGSFYVGWFMEGATVALITETEGPISNRTYEVLSGSWAKYRAVADAMLRAVVVNPFFVATEDVIDNSPLRVYPNPNNGAFNIDNTLGEETIEHIRIVNALGATVFEKRQYVGAGQQWNVETGLGTGLYYLELRTADGRRIIRKVLVD